MNLFTHCDNQYPIGAPDPPIPASITYGLLGHTPPRAGFSFAA
jgi:hypothetical protein